MRRRARGHIVILVRDDLVTRARRDVSHAVHSGADWVTMTEELGAAIRKVVPFDFHAWHTMDPATLIFTGVAAREAMSDTQINDPDSCRWLGHCEYGIDDVIQWSSLARSSYPIGILSHATHGNRELSPRYRRMLKPLGFEGELRASFVRDSNCWGAVSFCRGRATPDFDEQEAHFLASLSTSIADGFRRALLVTAGLPDDAPDGPGMVVLDHNGELEAVTDGALRWMDEIVDDRPSRGMLPAVLDAVAARARHVGNMASQEQSARARACTRSGRWLVIYGMRLQDRGEGRIGLVIEPATSREMAPLMLAAYRLTERERQVGQEVIAGASTEVIARTLNISANTVQDHLKSVFRKTGVHSRRELVAKVFFEDYRPRTQTGETIDASGWFAQSLAAGIEQGPRQVP
jgi:DNA-binding CsgD family transcriptional regulator